MKVHKLCALLTVLVLAPAIHAADSGWTKVTRLDAGTGNTPVMTLQDAGAAAQEPGCTVASGGPVIFPSMFANDGAKRMFSIAATALAADREVQIGASGCLSGMPVLTVIRIR